MMLQRPAHRVQLTAAPGARRRILPASHRFGRRLLLTLLAGATGFGQPVLCQDATPDLTAVGIEAVMNMEVTSVSKTPERFMDAAAAESMNRPGVFETEVTSMFITTSIPTA